MTIKQMAAELKVSPQAVYQKLRNNEIDVKTLTTGKNRDLTSEGEYIVRQLFSEDTPQPVKKDQQAEIEKEVVELRKQVAELLEKNKELKESNESLREDKEYFKKALDKAQDNLSEFKALLPGPTQPRRLTWRERFSGKIK